MEAIIPVAYSSSFAHASSSSPSIPKAPSRPTIGSTASPASFQVADNWSSVAARLEYLAPFRLLCGLATLQSRAGVATRIERWRREALEPPWVPC